MEFISPESEVLARDGAEKITVNFARENPIHLSRFTKAVFNSADNDVLLFSPRVDAFNANERFTKLPLEDHSRESLRSFLLQGFTWKFLQVHFALSAEFARQARVPAIPRRSRENVSI